MEGLTVAINRRAMLDSDQCSFDPPKVGSKALPRPEIPVDNLIFQSNEFTIWLNDKLDVWWHTADGFGEKMEALERCDEWGEIMSKQIELESMPMGHLSVEAQRGFRFQVGHAIYLLFTGKFDTAKRTMAAAESSYRSRTAEKARMWILQSGVIAVFIVTLAAGFTGWFGNIVLREPNNLFEQIILAAFAGLWGAFISLVLRASVLGIDATAGALLHFMESFCRLLTGAVAGGIGLSAVVAGIIAPNLLKLGSAMIILIGFMAGFTSERFLPSLVGKVDSSMRSNNQAQANSRKK